MDYFMQGLNAAAACSANQVVVNDGQGGTYCIDSSVLATLTHPANATTTPHASRQIPRLQHRMTAEQSRWAAQDVRQAAHLATQQAQLTKLGVPCPVGQVLDSGGQCRMDPLAGVHGMAGLNGGFVDSVWGDMKTYAVGKLGWLAAGAILFAGYAVLSGKAFKRKC